MILYTVGDATLPLVLASVSCIPVPPGITGAHTCRFTCGGHCACGSQKGCNISALTDCIKPACCMSDSIATLSLSVVHTTGLQSLTD